MRKRSFLPILLLTLLAGCLRDFNNPIDPETGKAVPPKPHDLKVLPIAGDKSMLITFGYSYENATGVVIERADSSGGPYDVLDTLVFPTVRYTDSLKTQNRTVYFYRVYAINANGPSDQSGTASDTTDVQVVRDNSPPDIRIFFGPNPVADFIRTTSDTVNLTGTVTDGSGVKTFTINGKSVTINTGGRWSFQEALNHYTTRYTFVATDSTEKHFADTLQLAVYFDYHNIPPALEIDTASGKLRLAWHSSAEPDFASWKLWLAQGAPLDTTKAPSFSSKVGKDTAFTNPGFSATKSWDFLIGLADSAGNLVVGPNGVGHITGGLVHRGRAVFLTPGGFIDGEGKHATITRGFYIDTTEVTQAHYKAVTGFNSSLFSGLDHPAENVNWYDALLYCNARSKAENLDTVYEYAVLTPTQVTGLKAHWEVSGYRLPTEDEWEYAARAGTNSTFYWGEDTAEVELKKYAWYNKNATEIIDFVSVNPDTIWTVPHAAVPGTQTVALKRPNAWGLYDIAGNAAEWCWDLRPDSGWVDNRTDYRGENTGLNRPVRGGSWIQESLLMKSGIRPSTLLPTLRQRQVGIRPVLPIK